MKRLYTKMMACLDYVFYRITKCYIKHGETFDDWPGYIIVAASVGFWACGVLFLLFGLLGYSLPTAKAHMIVYGVLFLISLILFRKRYISESLYRQLCKKYNQETNAKLKGWGVFLFIIFSILFYLFGLYVEFTQFFRVPIR